MTSVMGILSTKPRESIAGELDQMLAAAPREPWYVEGRRIDGTRTTAVGRLTHDGAALGQAGTKCDGISGEVTLFGDLYALPAEQPRSDRAGAFLRGYAAAGDRFLEQVQGGFIAIFADDAKGVVR